MSISEDVAVVDLASLMDKMASGDSAAMADFYNATSAQGYGLAVRILGDTMAAEDAVAEAYTYLWESAHRYDPRRGTPVTWLLTIIRSRAIDILRRQRRTPTSPLAENLAAVPTEGPLPEEAVEVAAQRLQVRVALDRLEPRQREAIELAYFGGLSQSEIASRLGQPLGTVKTRVRAALIQLREQLVDWQED